MTTPRPSLAARDRPLLARLDSMHPLLVYRNWTQILRARKHAHGEECRLDSIDTETVAEKVAIDLIPPRVASRRQLTPHPAFGHPLPREREKRLDVFASSAANRVETGIPPCQTRL